MTQLHTNNIERTALNSADPYQSATCGQVHVRVIKGDSKMVDQSVYVRVNQLTGSLNPNTERPGTRKDEKLSTNNSAAYSEMKTRITRPIGQGNVISRFRVQNINRSRQAQMGLSNTVIDGRLNNDLSVIQDVNISSYGQVITEKKE